MHLLIKIDGVLNGQIVVNTEGEKAAREVYEHHNGVQGSRLSFEEPEKEVVVPGMFTNCIMDAKDFV